MTDAKVHPIADEALGNTSYFVEAGGGEAISIDPRRDVAEHLALASTLGLRIVAVLETHLHADFVSGSREIASATGAEIIAAKGAGLELPHRDLDPSDRLDFFDTAVEVIATPGHTPEHVSYLLISDQGRALFSGGSLIVGGAARTDLTGADRTDELARAQYASVRALAALPDETVLRPTHGGGSFCSTTRSRASVSTIGEERATNPLLAARNEEEFVDTLTSGFGSYPRYFQHLREVNRTGPSLLGSLPSVPQLSATDALKAVRQGAWLVDARPVAEWARAHAPDAVSIELRPAFASWLGWVVPLGEPIVLMLTPDQVGEAVRLAHLIGFDVIEGWVTFGAWRDAVLPVSSVDELEVDQAARVVESGAAFLDVRQAGEFASGHIGGAMHLELGDIIAGKSPDADDVVTYCGHGERSATAASLLARRGIRVANLRGGTAAWRAAGYRLGP